MNNIANADQNKIRATLRNGYLANPLTLDKAVASGGGFSIYFPTVGEAAFFFSTLPKFVKARCNKLGYHKHVPGEHGLVWIPCEYGSFAPFVSLSIDAISLATGVRNEAGEKRLARFVQAIEKHLVLVNDINDGGAK